MLLLLCWLVFVVFLLLVVFVVVVGWMLLFGFCRPCLLGSTGILVVSMAFLQFVNSLPGTC